MQSVDLSQGFAAILEFLTDAFSKIIDLLDNIYLLPGVSVLTLFIALVVLGMVITSVFVLFNGDVDD